MANADDRPAADTASGPGHNLTRLERAETRRYERRLAAVPCRLTFTRSGIRDLQVVFAVTRNVSQAGALLVLQHPVPDLEYFNVEFGRAARPRAAVVRRMAEAEVGCELLEPLTAGELIALVAAVAAR